LPPNPSRVARPQNGTQTDTEAKAKPMPRKIVHARQQVNVVAALIGSHGVKNADGSAPPANSDSPKQTGVIASARSARQSMDGRLTDHTPRRSPTAPCPNVTGLPQARFATSPRPRPGA